MEFEKLKKKKKSTDQPIPEKQGRVRGNKNIFKVGLSFHSSTYLFGFNKICHMSVIVGTPYIKSGSRPLATQSGDQAGFSLPVSCVNRPYLYAPTDSLEQPLVAVNAVAQEMQV